MNGTTRLAAWLGTWGKPVDRPATWALAVAVVLALVALAPPGVASAAFIPTAVPGRAELRRRVILVLAFSAAFLSLGYIAYYLRAGPRIIDATSYFLEGRVLSHGHFAWNVSSPSASFRGRFLLFREPGKLAVIFPPGFPLLLAAGFKVGAPLVVGPLLAGALVLATYWLATEVAPRDTRIPAHARAREDRSGIATLAAALSLVCAALRYHTADTMAHGASALGITVALASAFGATRRVSRAWWLLAGLSVGWVVCTRPVSSLSVLGVVLVLAVRHGRSRAYVLGIVPGALFLLAASRAQTGSWFASAQSAYYAVSDGPPGCFRYGFGDGIGCQLEHKDFVAARLPHGFGLIEAALATLRRLRVHLLDIANFEPLAVFVVVPLRDLRDGRGGPSKAALCFAVVTGQVLAYAPFYFDGNYPGGGARLFADILPLEHVLIAVAVASVLPTLAFHRRAFAVLSLALLGFAVHGAFEHEALAARDGGRPMFDPEEVRGTAKGLLFFDTDHGFDLAYDPFKDASHSLVAARLRGDDHDRLLVERLDHPQAHVYRPDGRQEARSEGRADPADAKRSALVPWTAKPGATKDLWRFEAEADWPPLAQGGGWAEPVWASTSCATEGRVLTVHVEPGADGRVQGRAAVATLELPVPRSGKWIVTPRVMRRGGRGHGTLRLLPRGRAPAPGDAKLVWEWEDGDPDPEKLAHDTCLELPGRESPKGVELDVAGATWELTATSGDVSLDQTTLKAGR